MVFVGNLITTANLDVFSRILITYSSWFQWQSTLLTHLYLYVSASQPTLWSGIKCWGLQMKHHVDIQCHSYYNPQTCLWCHMWRAESNFMFSFVRALLDITTGRFLKQLQMDRRAELEGASGGPSECSGPCFSQVMKISSTDPVPALNHAHWI